jgi:catechol 2,3-dioxygenase-like lactoylglutathione lyase family enzyme
MDPRITNVKLVVSDVEASLAFYALFGLKSAVHLRFSDPDVDEVMLEDAHGQRLLVLLSGSVLPIPSSPGWAPLVIQVDDLDAAISQVTDAGYELAIEPFGLGPIKMVMALDPDGYLIEILQGDLNNLEGIPEGQRIPHPIPQVHERA